LSIEEKGKIEENNRVLVWGIKHTRELLKLHRSNIYYEPIKVSVGTLEIMGRINELFTESPFYGSRRIREVLG
jgi:putative transposase